MLVLAFGTPFNIFRRDKICRDFDGICQVADLVRAAVWRQSQSNIVECIEFLTLQESRLLDLAVARFAKVGFPFSSTVQLTLPRSCSLVEHELGC